MQPIHPVLMLMDVDVGVVPDAVRGALVFVDESAIAVGTAFDSDVRVVLTDELGDFCGLHLVYDGIISFPSGVAYLVLTDFTVVGSIEVACGDSRLAVYVNDLREPSCIIFSFGLKNGTGGF